MFKKKLQVFISSTYDDMKDERQAAVEAVLKAGHIPAGMELFRSGDESQIDTITKWIEESDVYLLILGGRYGSIEPTGERSYIHWEYELAASLGIPRFSIVITDDALDKKVKEHGHIMIEKINFEKYQGFRKTVLDKTSQFYEDIKDIKLTILHTLNEYAKNDKLAGWVTGKNATSNEKLYEKILMLQEENEKLKSRLEAAKSYAIKEKQNEAVISRDAVNFSEQLERILTLLCATEADYVAWEYTDNETGETEDVSLEHPSDDFTPYFIHDSNGEYDKLLVLTNVQDTKSSIPSILGDIRVMIRKYKDAEAMPIKFVIAIPGDHGALQNEVNIFLNKIIQIENITDNQLFNIEVWDSNVINKFSEDLCLVLSSKG